MIAGQVTDRLLSMLGVGLDVPVYDGFYTATDAPLFVVVGWSGDPDATDGASVTLAESDLGPGGWWDEAGSVECHVVAQSGGAGSPLAPLRAAAMGVVESAAGLVRADRSLGGLLAGAGVAAVSAATLHNFPVKAGSAVRVAFTVSYTTNGAHE